MLIVQYQYINLRYFYCTIANILSNISHEKLKLTIHSLCLKSRKPLPKSMISFGNIFLSVQGLRQNILKSLSIMRLENLCINVFIYLYLLQTNKQLFVCIFRDFIGHVVKMTMYFRQIVIQIKLFYSTGIVNKMFWVPNKIPVNRTECRCNCFDTVYKGRL